MTFPTDDKSKRMIEDGISIGMVATDELDRLIEKNELLLKSIEMSLEEAKFLGRADLYNIMTIATQYNQSYLALIPEILRISANAIDIMVQNQKKENES